MNIKNAISAADSPFNAREETSKVEAIMSCLEKRIQYCITEVHVAAYFLDQRYHGSGLTDTQFLLAVETIKTVSECMALDFSWLDILNDLTHYRLKTEFYSNDTIWEVAKQMHPIAWWKAFCSKQPLTAVAIRFANMKPTSAACERVWASFGDIHRKKRNRLSNRKIEKAVFVKANLQYFPMEANTASKATHHLEKYPVVELSLHEKEAEIIESEDDDDEFQIESDDSIWSSGDSDEEEEEGKQ